MKHGSVFKTAVLASSLGMSFMANASTPDPDPTPDPSGTCVDSSYITSSNLSNTGESGPYSVSTKNVSSWSADGFGDGTIWYSQEAYEDCGRMPGIAVIPGYVSGENSIVWWGERLASWGFVVITTNTESGLDQPISRAGQLSDALDHIIDDSTVGSMVDEDTLGAIGWSMGGGGSIYLGNTRSEVKAIIPQAPWFASTIGSDKPVLFIGCENDAIAPTYAHVNDFYDETGSGWFAPAVPKAKIEINNGSHYCANSGYSDEDLIGKAGIAWMKRFLSNDTRFNEFTCGQENYGSDYNVSDYDYDDC
ncbi:hypothetical protein NBRC116188_05440 [Oceaniserpentilla sp. 4NH20-0058]|uniref:poly(ethylene terephthalate) hydrolase family protein n=1 Tax=Oceaniserpentilla sp. 4NH20-0058 TaxID=3127660 RepID=UPI00310902C4